MYKIQDNEFLVRNKRGFLIHHEVLKNNTGIIVIQIDRKVFDKKIIPIMNDVYTYIYHINVDILGIRTYNFTLRNREKEIVLQLSVKSKRDMKNKIKHYFLEEYNNRRTIMRLKRK